MTLRARIAALTAGAVAIAVLVVSVGAWVLVRRELRQQVDEGLVRRMRTGERLGAAPAAQRPAGPRGPFEVPLDNAAQLITDSGEVVIVTADELPISDRDLAVAAGTERAYLHDERVSGVHVRMLTAPIGGGRAVLLARDLTEVDATLRGFAVVLIVLAGLGIAGAAAAGLLVARGAVAPVERLTGAAEHVARTKDLTAAIEVDGKDELARLGTSFNEMLSALSESKEQQRRLVTDASHELRTPLTSLRTNIEILARQPRMAPAERAKVLDDLRTESEELSSLMAELVALATEQRADEEEIADVQLDELVRVCADRAHRRTGRPVAIEAEPSLVRGRPLGLERAISNLLDNATKWGPSGETIDVSVAGGRVAVRDRGPGISEADRPHIFDRFYRATAARSMPGSGLGLSIVKQVVESHGGRVWAGAPDDGGPGAVVGFDLPLSDDS